MCENKSYKKNFEVPEEIIKKWQDIVNIMANILNVPAGLIMRIVDLDITVFLASETENNPYKPGDKEHFENSGLYCETVIKKNDMLLVPDALNDENWKNNPDVKLNMISYLGFSINLPDNTPFGTICVLDSKENKYSELYVKLVESFRNTIMNDLELLYSNYSMVEMNSQIKKLLNEKEVLLKEINHRVKNNIATIVSQLSVQAHSAESNVVENVLKESISRLNNLRVLYENLLIRENYKEVSMKSYMESLIETIATVFSSEKEIVVKKNMCDFTIDSNKAINIGIIVNELFTNIFKYAFKNRSDGEISIVLEKKENNVKFVVMDDGIGYDENENNKESSGFGLVMVKMLVDQLGGSFVIENCNGTKSTLEFEI